MNQTFGWIEGPVALRREDSVAIVILIKSFRVVRFLRFIIALSITAKDSLGYRDGIKTACHIQWVDLRN